MEIWASFPGHYNNKLPVMEELEKLFLDYPPEKWTDDASIEYRKESGETIRLVIVHHSKFGFWLQYEKETLTENSENYFSLGDVNRLDRYVELVEDSLTLEGLFVLPINAWRAVKYFISTEGSRTDKIHWISETDIPSGKHWLIAADCL